MKRTTRVHRSESDWKKLIEQHATSGLSVRAFCKQHQVGDGSFYLWRKRLAVPPVDTPAINLVDITGIVSTEPSARWHIELDLGDGIKLNLRQA
ncbi:MAG: IS66 family insertion sequence element accessory protein TnpB [bacterium]|nr:IS66 family insertion sequence element accessory protein TnpB [Gammaproteobacteria bacterium]